MVTDPPAAPTSRTIHLEPKRFDRAVRAIGLGVWYCDLPFDELTWDDQVKKHFWLEPSARVHIDTFYERIHPEDRERTRAAIQYSIEERSHYDIEYRTTNPLHPEEFRWIRAIGWTDYNDQGQPIRFDGITIDVTENRNLAAGLAIRQETLENSLNGFDIVNAEGRLIYVNRAYLKMWGYDSPDEVLGTSPVHHCADPDTPKKIIQALRERGECELEFVARRKDGSLFDVMMWARLAHDAAGNEIYPTTSIDITERKKAERELKRALKVRDEFLSIASHELKTPLTTLKLQAQILDRKLKAGSNQALTPEMLTKYAATTRRQVDQLVRLVDDMLDISKIESGRMQFDFADIELSSLIEEAIEFVREQFAHSRVELQTQLRPATVRGDSFRLKQVFANLLTNALKYGAGRPVQIRSSQNEQEIRIDFRDLGIGIEPEHQSRIFERFERSVSASETSGLGLGLFIAREIVRAHGGRIDLISQPAQGSTFTVVLPRT